MLSLIRDIPFIETITPVAMATMLWTGANIFTIGPDFVAPRLAAITYIPACKASVAQQRSVAHANRQSEIDRIRNTYAQKQNQVNSAAGTLITGLFGEQFANAYGNSMMNSLNTISDMEVANEIQQRLDNIPKAPNISADYCGCVVREAFGDRVSTGLYSASLRIWKPDNILRLDQLNTHLISSAQCGNPNK